MALHAPDLLGYRTWADETGYHAHLLLKLPTAAIEYGCVQELTRPTPLELTQDAVRNRIRYTTWESNQHRMAREVRFTTGDLP